MKHAEHCGAFSKPRIEPDRALKAPSDNEDVFQVSLNAAIVFIRNRWCVPIRIVDDAADQQRRCARPACRSGRGNISETTMLVACCTT
jgi:hypothetical protein